MLLRFTIPAHLHLYGPRQEMLFPADGTFTESVGQVRYRLEGDNPREFASLPPRRRHIRVCNRLQIEVAETDDAVFRPLVEAQDWPHLTTRLTELANRILRGIRNFGTVPHIAEVKPDLSRADSYLKTWGVAFAQVEGQEPQELFPDFPAALAGLHTPITARTYEPWGELDAFRWADIVEAVEENREPGPEHEFFTNSIEHVRLGNLRYVLLEAVICLEIVLTRWLRLFLERRNVSQDRIDRFLNPQLGLAARVAVLLDLTLDPSEVARIPISQVLRAVKWRNDVVHKSGNLPPSLPQASVEEGVEAILALVSILSRRYEELHAEPTLRNIGEQLHREFGGGMGGLFPSLRARGGRRIAADFSALIAQSMPESMNC